MTAVIKPAKVLSTPSSCGRAGRMRSNTNTSTAHIDNGTNQSNGSSCLARLSPLRVSFAPAQLTCTQGKKKHTSTMIVALRLIRLSILKRSTLLYLHVLCCEEY